MKGRWIVFLVLVVLALTLLVGSVVAVTQIQAALPVEQEILQGDPAAAQGLHVYGELVTSRHLVWSTDHVVGQDARTQLESRYSTPRYPRQEHGDPVGHFDLMIGMLNQGYSGGYWEEDLERLDAQFYVKPILEALPELEPGDRKIWQVRLADYYDRYLILPDYWMGGGAEQDPASRQERETRLLSDYFRFPVPEELILQYTVQLDAEGTLVEMDTTTYYDRETMENRVDAYGYANSLMREDGVLFVIMGNMDFSRSKEGYGLYYVPRMPDDPDYGLSSSLDFSKIRNVHPLPQPDEEDYMEAEIRESPDKSQLYVFFSEDGVRKLHVLDSTDFHTVQELTLPMDRTSQIWMEDGVLCVVNEFEDRMVVLEQQADGTYTKWLDTEILPAQDGYFQTMADLLFDGERLAVGSFWVHDSLSHRVQVFDKNGMVFGADYRTGFEDLPDDLSGYIWENPRLSWE